MFYRSLFYKSPYEDLHRPPLKGLQLNITSPNGVVADTTQRSKVKDGVELKLFPRYEVECYTQLVVIKDKEHSRRRKSDILAFREEITNILSCSMDVYIF